MFFGNNDQAEKQKGKRTSGFASRKDGEFSLGWNVTQQKNEFQVRREQKQQSMATKVTDQKVIQSHQQREKLPASTVQEKCRQLIDEYPDITTEQLHERLALWELSNKQQIGRPAQKNDSRQPQKVESRQAPIKPVESAKGAIYGGNNDQAFNKTHGRASKRNQGTFALGDGYNYFKDENNRR